MNRLRHIQAEDFAAALSIFLLAVLGAGLWLRAVGGLG